VIAAVGAKRGSKTRGLIEYLWGPGEDNEHTHPHVIAAWDSSFVRGESAPVFDAFERGLMAREMDAPLRLFGEETGKKPGEHVYHVSVSLSPADARLTDEQWNQVATEAAEKLGFTATEDRAAVPWIAMRHGMSKNGNDHVHFVAVACREDGTHVDLRGDFGAWAEVRHNAEDRWGLTPTRGRGGGMPGLERGEVKRAEREDKPEPDRLSLARSVRSAATGARNEADFVHRMRRSGVLVRPRWEQGGHRKAVGYSVAWKPKTEGQKPVWYGGGKLAGDLRLTEVRRRWDEPDVATSQDVLRAWRPPGWRQMPTGRALQRHQLRVDAWQAAATKIAEARASLSQIDSHNEAAWAGVARETSGVLASLAGRTDIEHREQLRDAADALAGVGQTERGTRAEIRPAGTNVMAGVVRVAGDALLAGYGGPYAAASLVMQMGRLVRAIQHANEVAGRAAQVQRANQSAEYLLTYLRETRPAGQPASATTQDPAAAREPSPRGQQSEHEPAQLAGLSSPVPVADALRETSKQAPETEHDDVGEQAPHYSREERDERER
jgi:hypothetical protein